MQTTFSEEFLEGGSQSCCPESEVPLSDSGKKSTQTAHSQVDDIHATALYTISYSDSFMHYSMAMHYFKRRLYNSVCFEKPSPFYG